MRILLSLLLSTLMTQVFSQDQAIEIYLRTKPSKKYVIKIDDKVLIKCRNFRTSQNRFVEARFGQIDSNKFYFYPIDKQYRESIYTLSTLNEIGVRTPLSRAFGVVDYVLRIRIILRGGYTDLRQESHYSYKMVNVKTRKWDVQLIDNP
jgi:hypothetical protein